MVRIPVSLRRLRNQGGQTLVEMLTVMSILGLVMTGIISLYLSGVRAQSRMGARFDAQTTLQVGLDKIRKDVHLSCSVATQSTTSVTLSLSPCDGTNMITWCTQGSGTHYGLYRITGSTCTGGFMFSDYLTGGSIFSYLGPNITNTTPATGSYALARLHLDITVNETPTVASTAYHVIDDVAFSNSVRCTAGTNCPA